MEQKEFKGNGWHPEEYLQVIEEGGTKKVLLGGRLYMLWDEGDELSQRNINGEEKKEAWPGIDEAVVERYAAEYGRPAREPIIKIEGDTSYSLSLHLVVR